MSFSLLCPRVSYPFWMQPVLTESTLALPFPPSPSLHYRLAEIHRAEFSSFSNDIDLPNVAALKCTH